MNDDDFAAAVRVLEATDGSNEGLCQPFLDLFRVDGASVSTLGSFLGSETLGASDTMAVRLDELQFDLGEGPCWTAKTEGRPAIEPDVKNNPTAAWPAFFAAIRDDDVGALFAFPLRIGSLQLGAIDLYSQRPRMFEPLQERQAAAFAHIISRHVLRSAIRDAGGEESARPSPYSRRIVHQATGMVLAQVGISATDAHLLIQGHAFASGRSMKDVAEDILQGTLQFYPRGQEIEERP